jgi:hypothetical protein
MTERIKELQGLRLKLDEDVPMVSSLSISASFLFALATYHCSDSLTIHHPRPLLLVLVQPPKATAIASRLSNPPPAEDQEDVKVKYGTEEVRREVMHRIRMLEHDPQLLKEKDQVGALNLLSSCVVTFSKTDSSIGAGEHSEGRTGSSSECGKQWASVGD